jgi:hypothetical protein
MARTPARPAIPRDLRFLTDLSTAAVLQPYRRRSAASPKHPPKRSGRTSRPGRRRGHVNSRDRCPETFQAGRRPHRAGAHGRGLRPRNPGELDRVGQDRSASPADAGPDRSVREPRPSGKQPHRRWLPAAHVRVPAPPSGKQPHRRWLPAAEVRVPAGRKHHRGAPIASPGGLGARTGEVRQEPQRTSPGLVPGCAPAPPTSTSWRAVWRCASCGRGPCPGRKTLNTARRPLGWPGQSLLLVVARLARRGSRKDIKGHPRVILLTRHAGPLTSPARCRLAGPSSSVEAPRRCDQQPTAGGANTVPPADHRISRMTTPANPGHQRMSGLSWSPRMSRPS